MTKVGDIINSRWSVVKELSTASGQGNTFLVVDDQGSTDETQYVIKLLRVKDPKALARFGKEIKASFALKHPNIISVKDSAYENTQTPYLVTEYCSGRNLTAEKIRDLPTIERLRIFEYVCEAIAHAHQQGVIHRDIKPDNIFLKSTDSFIPIVGDFGLCFFKDDNITERPTAPTSESMGNWQFGPPERSRREEHPSGSFDVYQLGKLLYWLLSGGVILDREYYDKPYFDLRKDGADHVVHMAYETFAKSVTEDPARRYPTATEMLDEVKELVVFAEDDGRYLDCVLPQACGFCRIGAYAWKYLGTHANDRYQLEWYGLRFDRSNITVVYPLLLIGTCGRCGNIQQFRLDKENKLSAEWKNLPRSPFT